MLKRLCLVLPVLRSRLFGRAPPPEKGRHRKVSPEDLREAIEAVLPEFREQAYNKMAVYRRCIERGILAQSECSQTSFFRTVRDKFLIQNLDLSSLDALNRQFHDWVENEYNAREHGTLKMKPVDRFAMDLKRIRFLDPVETNDELFYFEQDRNVRKDNTFSVAGRRFEAPRDLRSRTVQVRYDRTRPGRVIVYLGSDRMGEALALDPVGNDRPAKRP